LFLGMCYVTFKIYRMKNKLIKNYWDRFSLDTRISDLLYQILFTVVTYKIFGYDGEHTCDI